MFLVEALGTDDVPIQRSNDLRCFLIVKPPCGHTFSPGRSNQSKNASGKSVGRGDDIGEACTIKGTFIPSIADPGCVTASRS